MGNFWWFSLRGEFLKEEVFEGATFGGRNILREDDLDGGSFGGRNIFREENFGGRRIWSEEV